jgi:hypothetical protein
LIRLRIASFSIFVLSVVTLGAQGPLDGYLKGKGVLDLAPSFSFLSARQFNGAPGETYDLPYRGNLFSLFAEYGLTERLDVVATVPYIFTSTQSGFQDGDLYLKYRPVYKALPDAGKIAMLIGAGYSFPLSDYQPVAEGALGQRAQQLPARLIVQWESPFGLFINATGGYTWRFDRFKAEDVALVRQTRPDFQPAQPSHFATFLFRVGFPAAHYYLDAWVERRQTRGGTNYQPNVPDLPQAYGVSYTQIGGTAYYSENGKTGFILSGAYIPSGRNVSKMLRLTVGMVVKLTKLEENRGE